MVTCPGHMGFTERDLHTHNTFTVLPQTAVMNSGSHTIKDHFRHEFRGGVSAIELGQIIQIFHIELGQHLLQHIGGKANIDNQVVIGLASNVLKQVLARSEEHTSELQSRENLVCRLLLEKKKKYHETYLLLSSY